MAGQRDESTIAAASAALSPYPWRTFAPELLARWVLAANDREALRRLLVPVPGAALGAWDELEPAEPDDHRAKALVEFLASHRWTEYSLTTLCQRLLAVLDDAG